MTDLSDFIDDARKVPLENAFAIVGGVRKKPNRSGEEVGPCPCCGKGKDRFSINFKRGVWLCRHYDGQGGDGLALIAHRHGLDLKRRAEFLEACSLIQGGRPIPAAGERETEAERQARLAKNAARQAEAEAERQQADADSNAFREKAIARGRGIYFNAGNGLDSPAEDYLRLRTGAAAIPPAIWENLRFRADQSYWHGKDERGREAELHCGLAIIAPFVDPLSEDGRITGCHQTWIDLGNAPKYRPVLVDDAGEALPTKKMQGAKKGSVIPVLGDLDAARWMVGEGIENVFAAACFEGFRDDTFYAAAGDIGNISGPAAGSVSHPDLKKQDAKGRWQPVKVAGPVPRPGSEGDCFQLPPHVRSLTLLGDRDSEWFFTINAMMRAEIRLARFGLSIRTEWPPPPFDDFSEFHLAYRTRIAA